MSIKKQLQQLNIESACNDESNLDLDFDCNIDYSNSSKKSKILNVIISMRKFALRKKSKLCLVRSSLTGMLTKIEKLYSYHKCLMHLQLLPQF